MNELKTKTIKEITLKNPETVRIFQEFKIDFCCGGKRLFGDACAIAGADPKNVTEKILTAIYKNDIEDFPEFQSASKLIDFIVKTHHFFTRTELERLSDLLMKVVTRHGENHLELTTLLETFDELCRELLPHMHKEEMILFPYIKHLELSLKNNLSSPVPPFGSVNNPISMMMFEHDSAGELLKKMREITSDYKLPEGACMSFRALYFGLEELEKDLHRHIHLENNVVFPKAVELEKKVLS
jgi:regulator of cell morphogenesis and NO signaling